MIETGQWNIRGSTYSELDGKFKGEITMKSDKDFFVNCTGEYNSPKYTGLEDSYKNISIFYRLYL